MSRTPPRSTVPAARPPHQPRRPLPPTRPAIPRPVPRKVVGRLLDDDDASLLDVIDNLLNRGVVLNAEIVLALANVDLVYLRLAALLCAADRLFPRDPAK
jgi:Gas vesicle protein